jgi:DNA-binding CsgD family transcriptional regulator
MTRRGAGRTVTARDNEQARLTAALAGAREGRSAAIVVHGEAGIGKTTLLDDVATRAEGFQTIRVDGVEAERDLAFAGLHRVLGPYLSRREKLAPPQRNALDAAFGFENGPPAGVFLVGLATLTLLTDAARTQPLLVVVDDAQWLDGESLTVLAFVARRLDADPVVMLFAERAPDGAPPTLEGVDSLPLQRLSDAEAVTLLDASGLLPADPTAAERVIREAVGNPLALVEVSRQLTDAQRSGATLLPEHLPLSERLERRFLAESRGMSDDAQRLLLIAAADGSADGALIANAAAVLGLEIRDDLANEVSQFLRLSPDVAFRHPLIRSAVYRGARLDHRHAVHRALAAALGASGDLDRRAWHLAAATLVPDEQVAMALDDGAERAQRRGGYSAEAAFRLRAAELSIDGHVRRRRLLAAGRAALNAGVVTTADDQLHKIAGGTDDVVFEAETMRLRASIHVYRDQHVEAATTLVDSARMVAPFDRVLAREALLDATNSFLVTQLLAMPDNGLGTKIADLFFATRDDEPECDDVRDVVLEAWALRFTGARKASAEAMRRAAELVCRASIDTDLMIRLSFLGYLVAFESWDDRALARFPARVLATMRDAGALNALRVAAMCQAAVDLMCGRFHDAELRHAETLELTSAIGGDPDLYRWQSLELAAWRGLDGEVRPTCEYVIQVYLGSRSDDPPQPSIVFNCDMHLLVLALGSARYRDALPHAQRLFDADPPQFGVQALPSIVEVAVRAGAPSLAQDAYERLAERVQYSPTAWALGLLARTRALVTPDAHAEQHYVEALDLLEQTVVTTDVARAELLYGEWLRRQKRRSDARSHLRRAFEMFDEMGATSFAERASRELVATGEHVHRDPIASRRDLTPQEEHVARLAAARATNREIAAQLFISANTVEYHLRKVFRKLGVTSRRDLEAVFSR